MSCIRVVHLPYNPDEENAKEWIIAKEYHAVWELLDAFAVWTIDSTSTAKCDAIKKVSTFAKFMIIAYLLISTHNRWNDS